MDKSALKEALASNLPVTIFTGSGEKYESPHQDFVFVAPAEGTTVVVFGENGTGMSLLDLNSITDVQLGQVQAPAANSES